MARILSAFFMYAQVFFFRNRQRDCSSRLELVRTRRCTISSGPYHGLDRSDGSHTPKRLALEYLPSNPFGQLFCSTSFYASCHFFRVLSRCTAYAFCGCSHSMRSFLETLAAAAFLASQRHRAAER